MASYEWPGSGGGVGGITPYPTFSDFPALASDGAAGVALDTDTLYIFNLASTTWFPVATPGDALSIGTFDSGATPSIKGLQIVSNQLIAQSATGSFPGMVNTSTQTFAGTKSFTSAILASDGTQSAPGISFINEASTGLYRVGTTELGISVGNQLALDMFKDGANTNFGFGTAAIQVAGNALHAGYTYNGVAQFNYSNYSTGTSAVTQFVVGAGPGGNAPFFIENHAYNTSGPFAGGCAFRSSNNLTQLTISSEYTTGYMNFLVGGGALINEVMRLTTTSLTMAKGTNLVLSGSTSGALTMNAGATGTVTLNWPTANAAGAVSVDGSGNVTFAPLTNANLATMAADTLKGNNTGSAASPSDLTVSQVNTMLGLTGAVTSVGTFGSSPNSAGLSIASQVLTMQPANATNPGGVSTTTQTFAGNKTFTGITKTAGVQVQQVTITNTYTLDSGASPDEVVFCNFSAAKTVTLPAVSAGRRVIIKDVAGNAVTNNITISPASGTIDGVGSKLIATNYGSLTITSDGTNWWIC